MQKKSVLLILALGATLAAGLSRCVTEEPRRAVVIEGQRIFAPRGYLGRWIRVDRPDQGLAFQLPPGAALSVVRSTSDPEAYDITRTVERPDGSVSFRIAPRGRSGRAGERHFRLTPDSRTLFEIFPGEDRKIQYQRVK